MGEAVGTGRADALLVAGVFFDLDSDYPDEPAALTAIANAASAATELNKFYRMNDTVQLSTIWDGTGYYYTYAGGLTTPTCNEVVTWVVMENVKKVTQETLNKIKVMPPSSRSQSCHGGWNNVWGITHSIASQGPAQMTFRPPPGDNTMGVGGACKERRGKAVDEYRKRRLRPVIFEFLPCIGRF